MIVWKVAAYCTQVEPDTLMVLSAVPRLRSSRAQDRMLAAGPLSIAYWTLVRACCTYGALRVCN
jgi:hypothetical protein